MACRCPYKMPIRLTYGCVTVRTEYRHDGWYAFIEDSDGHIDVYTLHDRMTEREAIKSLQERLMELVYREKPKLRKEDP